MHAFISPCYIFLEMPKEIILLMRALSAIAKYPVMLAFLYSFKCSKLIRSICFQGNQIFDFYKLSHSSKAANTPFFAVLTKTQGPTCHQKLNSSIFKDIPYMSSQLFCR